jgi:hypothetical protein
MAESKAREEEMWRREWNTRQLSESLPLSARGQAHNLPSFPRSGNPVTQRLWVPAFAGMTAVFVQGPQYMRKARCWFTDKAVPM